MFFYVIDPLINRQGIIWYALPYNVEKGGIMIRVKFNNKPTFYDVSFELLSNKIKLTGDKLIENVSGFKAYRLNGDELGDYSDYTVCNKENDALIFEKERKDG